MTTRRGRILVVDNQDSFVHTLIGYLVELGAACDVIEADAVGAATAAAAIDGHAAVLLSPGPGSPEEAGASIPLVHAAAATGTPLLGVCLGHQAIGAAFGARVRHARELMHGMVSEVRHDHSALFSGLPDPFPATRYHSLAIDAETVPPVLRVTAMTASGVIMGVTHRTLPIHGVQFHPESVLTEGGYRLLGNWLDAVGVAGALARGATLQPHRTFRAAR